LALVINTINDASSIEFVPKNLTFRARKYSSAFPNAWCDVPSKFGQPVTSFEISPQFLSSPLQLEKVGVNSDDTEVYQGANPASAELKHLPELLRPYILSSRINISDVAGAFGMKRRTFQRALGELGSNYRQLVNDVRLDIAREELARQERSIKNIALMLNYSNPGDFSRSFKLGVGLSPQIYRQSLQTD